MRRDEYRQVVGQVRDLARERGLLDIADYDAGEDSPARSELLTLLGRLRQELFLHSTQAVRMTTDRLSEVLSEEVPPVLVVESDPATADRLGIRTEEYFEGSLSADDAIQELNALIRLLSDGTDEDEARDATDYSS
ncbi:hypothetical protein ACIQUC_17540 [Curtobacterium sp. NPDC098951]|uniref:hypothetical protein n=1 Tax=Curtobacterium sp. NPDC098951 TaxID=3363974 RepID=UPI0038211CFD